MDGVLKWTDENVFCLNPTKCKEMQIDFRKSCGASIPLESEGKPFEVVKSAKILGLTVRDDLKWSDQSRCQMSLEFVGSLLCIERFSLGTLVSPLLKNQNLA